MVHTVHIGQDVKRVQIKFSSFNLFNLFNQAFFIPQSHLICLVGTSAWHHIVEQHLPGPAPRGKMDK